MKLKFLSLLLLAGLAAAGLAGDPPTIPATLTIKINRLAKIAATSPTAIKWINTFSDDLDMIPDSSGRSAIIMSPKAGVYRIAVYTADPKDGPSEPAYCTITVVDPTPPPPPVPPAPPGPVSALSAAVQSAYALETDAAKGTQLTNLAALYRQMAVKVADPTNAGALATVTQLFTVFRVVEGNLGFTPATLSKVRRVLGDYLNSQIGTQGAVSLDRVKAAAAFQAAADALGTTKRKGK